MGKNKKYSDEFKQEVLAMVAGGERSVSQIERDLDITPGLIYKWQQRYRVVEEKLQPSAERVEEAEIRRLKREVEITRQERDILKKPFEYSRGGSREALSVHSSSSPADSVQVCDGDCFGWSPESGVDHVFSSPCGSLNVQSGICLRLHRLGVIQREHADSHRSGGFCHGLLECEPPTPHLLAVVGSVRASANRKTHSSPPPAPRTSAAPDTSGDELL